MIMQMSHDHGLPLGRGGSLSAVDLNLLPVLHALLRERHVTRAARAVGLSQPAASRALSRLRSLLGDPLLVRKGRDVVLTPRAEALRGPLGTALGLVEDALARPKPFDPRAARQTVRIATDDYGVMVVLRPLLPRLARSAPGIDVRIVPTSGNGMQMLERGAVELFLGPVSDGVSLPPGLHAEPLATDRFVSMVARGHAFARRAPTLQRFAAARHALIAPLGEPGGFVDDALVRLGRERRVPLVLPHFMVTPFLIATSDLVLTLAERVAHVYSEVLPVALFRPPLALPSFTVGPVWHERDLHDPVLVWFRGEIARLRGTLAKGPTPREVRSSANPSHAQQ